MTQVFIILLILSSFSQNSVSRNDYSIEKITIKKVDFSIYTNVSVKCEDFEKHFNDKYSMSTLSNTKDIEAFLAIFNDSPPLDSSFNHYVVDTRVKAEIFFINGSIESICIGNPAFKKNGGFFQNTAAIRKYIESINPD